MFFKTTDDYSDHEHNSARMAELVRQSDASWAFSEDAPPGTSLGQHALRPRTWKLGSEQGSLWPYETAVRAMCMALESYLLSLHEEHGPDSGIVWGTRPEFTWDGEELRLDMSHAILTKSDLEDARQAA